MDSAPTMTTWEGSPPNYNSQNEIDSNRGGAYLGYVFLDPQERSTLIEQSSIEIAIIFDILRCQKSIQPDSVLELDKHHLVSTGADELRAIILSKISRSSSLAHTTIHVCIGVAQKRSTLNK